MKIPELMKISKNILIHHVIDFLSLEVYLNLMNLNRVIRSDLNEKYYKIFLWKFLKN